MPNNDNKQDEKLITEDWLRAVGFKWHQLDRQLDKQWLLWLGDAVRDGNSFTSYEDLGVEVTTNRDGKWFCWVRGDSGSRYSRFLHIRFLKTQAELIALCEALTGQEWNPENNLYGSMRTPDQAARIREDDKRLDRKMMSDRKWREIEKDDSIGRALPEHREAYEKSRKEQENAKQTTA